MAWSENYIICLNSLCEPQADFVLLWRYILVCLHQVLAKLACGLNKPNRQTLLPLDSVGDLFSSLPVGKMWVRCYGPLVFTNTH